MELVVDNSQESKNVGKTKGKKSSTPPQDMKPLAQQIAEMGNIPPDGSVPGSTEPAASAPPPPPAPTPPPAPSPEATKFDPVPQLLVNILAYKRGHASTGDYKFRGWLRAYLNKTLNVGIEDKHGNMIVQIGQDSNKTLFSCHVDTVHTKDVSDATFQALVYDANLGHVFLDEQAKGRGTCLGADDGAGIYVMLRMIEAKVHGTYIFHEGEECGGIGSAAMASKEAEWLSRFDRAIAFDRKGTSDVINMQRGGMCCSYTFAKALCDALEKEVGHKYKTDTGTFTDTANYIYTIKECTNISVGYDRNHGPGETLDYVYLEKLVKACCKIDWEKLPASRALTVKSSSSYQGRGNGYGGYGGYQGDMYDDDHRTPGTYGGGQGKGGGQSKGGGSGGSRKEKNLRVAKSVYDQICSGELSIFEMSEALQDMESGDIARIIWAMAGRAKGLEVENQVLRLAMEESASILMQ